MPWIPASTSIHGWPRLARPGHVRRQPKRVLTRIGRKIVQSLTERPQRRQKKNKKKIRAITNGAKRNMIYESFNDRGVPVHHSPHVFTRLPNQIIYLLLKTYKQFFSCPPLLSRLPSLFPSLSLSLGFSFNNPSNHNKCANTAKVYVGVLGQTCHSNGQCVERARARAHDTDGLLFI